MGLEHRISCRESSRTEVIISSRLIVISQCMNNLLNPIRTEVIISSKLIVMVIQK